MRDLAALISLVLLRVIQYLLAAARPELWQTEEIARISKRRDEAFVTGDYAHCQRLHETLAIVLRCRDVGVERAFFGGESGEGLRAATCVPPGLSEEICSGLNGPLAAIDLLNLARRHLPMVDGDRYPLLASDLLLLYAAGLTELGSAASGEPDPSASAIRAAEQAVSSISGELAPGFRALGLVWLGNAYRCRPHGRAVAMDHALTVYQQAAQVFAAIHWPLEWSHVQLHMGRAFVFHPAGNRSENLRSGISHLSAALSELSRETMPRRWALALDWRGMARLSAQSNQDAEVEQAGGIEDLRAALTVRSEQHLPLEWRSTAFNLASALTQYQGEPREVHLDQAISLFNRLIACHQPHSPAWGRCQLNLGLAWFHHPGQDWAERTERAIEAFTTALTAFDSAQQAHEWWTVHHNLAEVYRCRPGDRRTNWKLGLMACAQALRARPLETHPLHAALTLLHQANLFLEMARSETEPEVNASKAVAGFRQSREVFRNQQMWRDYARASSNLALAFLHGGRDSAMVSANDAVAVCDEALTLLPIDEFPADAIRARIARARILAQTGSDDGLLAFRHVLSLPGIDAFPSLELEAGLELAELLVQRGDWLGAQPLLAKLEELDNDLAEREVTDAARLRRFADTAPLYANAALCHFHNGALHRALEVQEQGRMRMLREQLRQESSLVAAALPAEEQTERRKLVSALRQLEAEQRSPASRRRSLPEIAAELRATGQKLTALYARTQTGTAHPASSKPEFSGLVQALPRDGRTAIISFSITQCGALAIVASGTPGEPKLLPIFVPEFTKSVLRQLARRWSTADARCLAGWRRAEIERRRRPASAADLWQSAISAWDVEAHSILADIHHRLLALVRNTIEDLGAAEVILIPQGALRALPLHLAGAHDEDQKRYWFAQHVIRYAPSFSILQNGRAGGSLDGQSSLRLLALADPVGDLPFSRQEIQSIQPLFHNAHTLSGPTATVAALLQRVAEADVLHIACHGQQNVEQPYLSALLLNADAAGPDGAPSRHWTLGEILRDLRQTQLTLTVLSACESGLTGTGPVPDEYLTLAAGFLAAGSNAVVSSLWRIPDEQTAQLMARFYRNWLGGQSSPAQALRDAQLEFAADGTSPLFWGAFQVSGAGGSAVTG